MQREFFANRLTKRYRHLRKWAKRSGVYCYRLYDTDIPEIPLALDLYNDIQGQTYVRVFLYERPYEKSLDEEAQWLNEMIDTIADVLSIPTTHIFSYTRRKQRGLAQYEKHNSVGKRYTVEEGGLHFEVNLTDYLDTGLFFDHRLTRSLVQQESHNKRVLNLFCYTGAFSVYAAAGGARDVTSVDLSNTYLQWAQRNMQINGFSCQNASADKGASYFIQADVAAFLSHTQKRWDIIILDPPTFSNSKRTEKDLDINRDWLDLVTACIRHLSSEGILYFSTNSRRLHFDETILRDALSQSAIHTQNMHIADITTHTLPEDFRNKKIHRCWKISLKKTP